MKKISKKERYKAEETKRWLDFFDLIRSKVNNYAINTKTFNAGLANEINTLRTECDKILQSQKF